MADTRSHLSFVAVLVVSWVSCVTSSAMNTYYMETQCSSQILDAANNGITAGFIKVTQEPTYNKGLDCMLIILAPINYRVLVRFLELDIACTDFVQIYEDLPTRKPLTVAKCGENVYEDSVVVSSHHEMSVHFYSDYNVEKAGFTVVFTIIRSGGLCNSSEYECNNGYCIDSGLQCNGYDNCGDDSDQCVYGGISMMEIGVIVAVVTLLILIAVVAFIYFKFRRTKRHRFERETATEFGPVTSEARTSSVSDYADGMAYLAPEPERYRATR